MVVVAAVAADANNMYVIRYVVVLWDSVVVALTIALEGVEVHSALAKKYLLVGVVAVLLMNRSYHVSYVNSFNPRNARFS
jgi:hypothetical protein